uniref:Uncharacterized protein n=1 Tax=Arundo donax TaxID=35708 RepID=A0A0A9EGM3_ARUDO
MYTSLLVLLSVKLITVIPCSEHCKKIYLLFCMPLLIATKKGP